MAAQDSSTSKTSCSIFNFSGAHRPTISSMWDLLLSPLPRLQVSSTENLTYWSFAARWNKTKIFRCLVAVSEEALSMTNSWPSSCSIGNRHKRSNRQGCGLWLLWHMASASNGRLKRGKQQWWMDRETRPEQCILETWRCFSQLYCGLLQIGRGDDGA